MRRRTSTYLRISTVVLVTVTLAFTGLMAITASAPPKPRTPVPYVGMNLAYLYNKTTDIGGVLIKDRSHIIINYISKTAEGLFYVEAHEELFTFPLLVNATSRQYASGAEEGSYVGHLVPLNLSIGDVVMIYSRRNFTVISTSYSFQLREGIMIQAYDLLYQYSRALEGENYNQTIHRFFDKKTGIMLQELDRDIGNFSSGYGKISHDFEVTIVDDGTDNDKDGLTDFEELLVTRTDPLIPDTDQDLWLDTLDPWPDHILLPNGVILGALIIASISSIYMSRWLTRKSA